MCVSSCRARGDAQAGTVLQQADLAHAREQLDRHSRDLSEWRKAVEAKDQEIQNLQVTSNPCKETSAESITRHGSEAQLSAAARALMTPLSKSLRSGTPAGRSGRAGVQERGSRAAAPGRQKPGC